MAITIDNFKYYMRGTTDSSLTITLAASSVLFAFVDLANGGAAVSAMDCGGVAMNSIAAASTANLFAWICSAPPTGVTTWRMGLTGNFQHAAALVSYTGLPTTGMLGTPHPQSSGTASTYNISISSTSTQVVLNCIRAQGAANACFYNNGNMRLSGTNSGISRLIVADITGAASVSFSATVSTAATSWDSVAIPMNAAAVATTALLRMLLNVGA